MDDQQLAEQLAKTGNLMDLTYEDDWWEDDDWDGPVEAGLMARPYMEYLDSLTLSSIGFYAGACDCFLFCIQSCMSGYSRGSWATVLKPFIPKPGDLSMSA